MPISTSEQTFLDLAGIGVGLVDLVVVADGMIKERHTSPERLIEAAAQWSGKRCRVARNANRPGDVSLVRCPFRSAPVSGAGAEMRRYDLFASCPATEGSQSTYASASRAGELISIRGPSALSRRSNDVAWGGLYGRRSMDSKLLSQSGGFLACSLRHICAARHRVSNASVPGWNG